jgi:hypothetical protein
LQGFGEVGNRDAVRFRKVGDRPRHPEHPDDGPGAQLVTFGGALEEALGRTLPEAAGPVEPWPGQPGVEAVLAPNLPSPRGLDASTDGGRWFARPAVAEFVPGDGMDANGQIEAVA